MLLLFIRQIGNDIWASCKSTKHHLSLIQSASIKKIFVPNFRCIFYNCLCRYLLSTLHMDKVSFLCIANYLNSHSAHYQSFSLPILHALLNPSSSVPVYYFVWYQNRWRRVFMSLTVSIVDLIIKDFLSERNHLLSAFVDKIIDKLHTKLFI